MQLLQRQVDQLIVVDDGSGVAGDDVLSQVQRMGATVIRLEQNAGIATALNRGIERALANGAEFVLTLDQDTSLPPDYVTTALSVFESANPVTRLGMVVVDGVNGAPAIPAWIAPDGSGLVTEAIQTGMLTSRECIEAAGLLDERLVIDCVDTEYCLRVRETGYRIAVARGTDIVHAIGRRAELRPLGIPMRHRSTGRIATYQYHSPFRRYYIARNNVDLIFRYARRHPRWVLAVVKREAGGMIVSVLSGPNRLGHLLAVVIGTTHGILRRRGMIPSWLMRLVR